VDFFDIRTVNPNVQSRLMTAAVVCGILAGQCSHDEVARHLEQCAGPLACRKGVARALLAACEDAARDAGAQLLTLHARLADDAALQVA
jgi:GNAT superfamily N-acetyltransferase